jgi:hypothetical protein
MQSSEEEGPSDTTFGGDRGVDFIARRGLTRPRDFAPVTRSLTRSGLGVNWTQEHTQMP